jgi:transportin-1
MNAFLQGLSALSADPSARVRKAVCQAIILIATMQLSILEPMIGSICTFMLKGVLDDDEGVAMEACEFWSALSDDNDAHALLQSHLGTLIPSLISRLQLKEEQILQERIEEEAHASGEKEINFKPIHRRGKRDNQETEEEEEVVSAKWTLRKQAALVLDNLAVTFSAALVLPHALSAIQIKLQAGGSSQEVDGDAIL